MKNRSLYFQLLILIIFNFIFTFRRDGIFPFSESDIKEVLAWVNLTFSLLVFTLFILFVFSDRLKSVKKLSEIIKKHLLKISLATTIINIALIILLHIIAHNTYPQYYFMSTFMVVIYGLLGILLVILPFIKKVAKTALTTLGIVSFFLFLIPVLYFPLTAKIADLLPIIHEQLESFVKGENIYQYYLLDNSVLTQAVRQPGTTLSYLPAQILNIDLRVMSILFTFLTGGVLLKFAYKNLHEIKFNEKFMAVYLLLNLFMLSPYRHVRHDLYEPFYWFILTLSLYLLSKSRLVHFAVFWGIGIFTQTWNWLFSPFVTLFMMKKYGFKKALTVSLAYLIFGVGLLLIFILRDPSAYIEHVFKYYNKVMQDGVYAYTSIHLTPLFHVYYAKNLLIIFQVVGVTLTGILALFKLRDFNKLLVFLALVFFVFIQFNIITWNYMYINFLLILDIIVLHSLGGKMKNG